MKNIKHQFWLGPVMGALFGLQITQGADTGTRIFIAVFMAMIGLTVQGGLLMSSNFQNKKKVGFLGTEKEFLNTILYLAAHVVKSDEKIEESELYTIEKKLLQDFEPIYVKKYMEYVERSIEKDLSIKRICKVIVHEFDVSSKIQLMNFLISIVVIDGWMSKKEMAALREIAIAIRLPLLSFKSILAMHNYRLEGEQQKYERVKRTSGISLKRAYRILEIAETVADKQVKKAYRKLAVLHHPDKVIHLGEEFQKAAKSKFQKVADAYEIIKKKRGFK